ncbi:hypothetical protein [Salicibibacter kimchii]|uniref:Uncharacterized protein n=1 Tax=Salicibibacter kimchii TaxID=2099786 RepID=A0A345BUJ9_9BACI|nr:hypothetical protein [Salicibibacter kimchii]AXF54630.1 hypothetical protein DT065_00445 [Salicibibacter kimchii]
MRKDDGFILTETFSDNRPDFLSAQINELLDKTYVDLIDIKFSLAINGDEIEYAALVIYEDLGEMQRDEIYVMRGKTGRLNR